ncbi:dihydroorotase [Rubrimonas cliftonensis]|uniref:Dihydroorotase n=1 Tax=Rubrimonas cliftonensis TaxID=89524 RepID=A0A1H4BX27_9RHOB|nr:dihydroorotase [Rubrimonas cliftonensis]SEA52402.1 dihydroorotase [Rubrimonas cliftonensis]
MTAPAPETLTLPRPDDLHIHLRDGAMLRVAAPEAAAAFARALVMPNLTPPVVTAADARAYRGRIMAALPDGAAFTPLMTLYLTEATDPDDVAAAHAEGLVTAVKLYPAGATTNSDAGVRDVRKVQPVLDRMAEIGLPLCVHGEVTDPAVDIFDREAAFLDRVLSPLRARTPALRIVLEHVTTRAGVAWVRAAGPGVGGTITAHHLMLTRNDLLAGGVRPHYYCLPILKRAEDRAALREAATAGDPRFFLGTDSAPHLDGAKLAPCGCAGCYTAPVAMACLAQVFDEEGALDRLEGFACRHGAAFYGLSPNEGTVTLERRPTPPQPAREVGDGLLTVFDPGAALRWRVRPQEARP